MYLDILSHYFTLAVMSSVLRRDTFICHLHHRPSAGFDENPLIRQTTIKKDEIIIYVTTDIKHHTALAEHLEPLLFRNTFRDFG